MKPAHSSDVSSAVHLLHRIATIPKQCPWAFEGHHARHVFIRMKAAECLAKALRDERMRVTLFRDWDLLHGKGERL